MDTITKRLEAVLNRIRAAERRAGREPGAAQLLAVSKRHPASAIAEAAAAGQRRFGESYLQEALEKMTALAALELEWHFIGPLQSNKTREIAARFAWVHSVDRLKIARRLSEQRPAELPPLNICLQVNSSGEASKSGCSFDDLPVLAAAVRELPRLHLRGLMTLPAPADNPEQQRHPFAALRQACTALNTGGFELDTLSMGMSRDLEAAITEGATLVRVGSALFGSRD